MSWWELLTAAAAQGITEFLPLSSSGHLVIVHHWWGVAGPTLFVDVLLHAGTTLAVLLVFRRTIAAWLRQPRALAAIVLAMVPTVLLGLWLHDAAERSTQQPTRLGWEFIVTGVWIWLGHLWSRRKTAAAPVIYWWQALLIGVAQGIAVLPAVSRSGATISTALLIGVPAAAAVEFSLLLSVPAIAGATVYELAKAGWSLPHQLSTLQVATAFVVTFVVGWGMIRMLQWLTVRRRLLPFAWYCLALGAWLVMGGLR